MMMKFFQFFEGFAPKKICKAVFSKCTKLIKRLAECHQTLVFPMKLLKTKHNSTTVDMLSKQKIELCCLEQIRQKLEPKTM
jgi:hypothetical protein